MPKQNTRSAARAAPAPQSCEELIGAIFDRLEQPFAVIARLEAAVGGLAMGNGDPIPVETRKAHLLNSVRPSVRSTTEREQMERKLKVLLREVSSLR